LDYLLGRMTWGGSWSVRSSRARSSSYTQASARNRDSSPVTDTTKAWLYALREHIEEVEEDTTEAFQARQLLVKLLVESISADKRPEDGRTEIQITYRFGPPSDSEGYPADSSVGSFKNGSMS